MAQNERISVRDPANIYRAKLKELIGNKSAKIGSARSITQAIYALIDKAYFDEARTRKARRKATTEATK